MSMKVFTTEAIRSLIVDVEVEALDDEAEGGCGDRGCHRFHTRFLRSDGRHFQVAVEVDSSMVRLLSPKPEGSVSVAVENSLEVRGMGSPLLICGVPDASPPFLPPRDAALT